MYVSSTFEQYPLGVCLKNVFSDAELLLKFLQIYVLAVKYLTNVCVMYVMMYVVCVGRTDW